MSDEPGFGGAQLLGVDENEAPWLSKGLQHKCCQPGSKTPSENILLKYFFFYFTIYNLFIYCIIFPWYNNSSERLRSNFMQGKPTFFKCYDIRTWVMPKCAMHLLCKDRPIKTLVGFFLWIGSMETLMVLGPSLHQHRISQLFHPKNVIFNNAKSSMFLPAWMFWAHSIPVWVSVQCWIGIPRSGGKGAQEGPREQRESTLHTTTPTAINSTSVKTPIQNTSAHILCRGCHTNSPSFPAQRHR